MTCQEAGYTPQWIQPVDMFPHTAHIETVTLLERVTQPQGKRSGKHSGRKRGGRSPVERKGNGKSAKPKTKSTGQNLIRKKKL